VQSVKNGPYGTRTRTRRTIEESKMTDVIINGGFRCSEILQDPLKEVINNIMSAPLLERDMAAVFIASKDGTEEPPKLNALGYPILQTVTPVPSDIAVSQHIVRTVGLLPIQEVAKQ
jgi:hypothetical protein